MVSILINKMCLSLVKWFKIHGPKTQLILHQPNISYIICKIYKIVYKIIFYFASVILLSMLYFLMFFPQFMDVSFCFFRFVYFFSIFSPFNFSSVSKGLHFSSLILSLAMWSTLKIQQRNYFLLLYCVFNVFIVIQYA